MLIHVPSEAFALYIVAVQNTKDIKVKIFIMRFDLRAMFYK